MATTSSTLRDPSRSPIAKSRALTRRAARREKSARLFLAFVFPADLGGFSPLAR